MSNYHIRNISKNERNAVVIFHIPIPDENNSTPISLRLAVSENIKPRGADGIFGIWQSGLQTIVAGELTQIQNGELVERQEVVKFLAEDSDAQKQTKIDNRFNELAVLAVNKIRKELKFWGKDRDVI